MMVMPIPKVKKVRLKGKPLAKLNYDIHERDKYTCIIKGCDRHVALGEKFHHQPFGINKTDRIECGCLLCRYCHNELHFGKNSAFYKKQCEEYLSSLYPEYWAMLTNNIVRGESNASNLFRH